MLHGYENEIVLAICFAPKNVTGEMPEERGAKSQHTNQLFVTIINETRRIKKRNKTK